MGIQELGSLGELIAAIATIATLAYLALQIRQSNRSHQLAAIARIGESTDSWLGQVVQDTELLDTYITALTKPETLSRTQRARFDLLVVQFLRGTETAWLQAQWGLLESDYWAGYRETIRVIVGSQAGRQALLRNRRILSPSFAAEVDRILGSDPAEAS
jgi:hypothetical protein